MIKFIPLLISFLIMSHMSTYDVVVELDKDEIPLVTDLSEENLVVGGFVVDDMLSTGVLVAGFDGSTWKRSREYVLLDGGLTDKDKTAEMSSRDEFRFYGRLGMIYIAYPKTIETSYFPQNGDTVITFNFDEVFADEQVFIALNCDWDPVSSDPIIGDKVKGYILDVDQDGMEEQLTFDVTYENDEGMKDISVFLKDGEETYRVDDIHIDEIYVDDYEFMFLDVDGDGDLEIIEFVWGLNQYIAIYDYVVGGDIILLKAYDIGY